MPISTVIDHARRRLDTVVTGSVHLVDVRNHLDRVLAQHVEGYREIVDARNATAPFWSPGEIWRVPRMLGKPNGRCFGWRAIVVNGTVTFALARLFATIASQHLAAAVFHDVGPAERWLARSDDPFAQDLALAGRHAAKPRQVARR